MRKKIEFYFDFISPWAYVAHMRLLECEQAGKVDVDYRPIFLGALHQITGNSAPMTVAAKGAYMIKDLMRIKDYYKIPMEMNPSFPFNTVRLQRGYLVADQMGQGKAFRDAAFAAVWQQGKDMANAAVTADVLDAAGIDSAVIAEKIASDEVKQQLKDLTQEAADRGAFGAPTFFVDDEMFFGQDRLDFIESVYLN